MSDEPTNKVEAMLGMLAREFGDIEGAKVVVVNADGTRSSMVYARSRQVHVDLCSSDHMPGGPAAFASKYPVRPATANDGEGAI